MSKTIPQLPPAATLDGTEVLPVSQGGATAKATVAQVRAGLATAAQGAKADSAVQPAALASGLAGKADVASLATKLDASAVSAFGASLIDDADAATARATLGLGTAATQSIGAFATAAQGTKADTAVQPAGLAPYAPLASPTLTGTPNAPTAPAGTSTAQIANCAFVAAAIAALVNSSPTTLDTLNELATALGNDPNFATTMATALGLKAPLASPALTGTPTAPTAAPGVSTTQIATTAFVQAAAALLAPASHAHTAAADVYAAVAAILTPGTNITVTPNGTAKTLTVAASGAGGAGGVTLSPTDRSATCRLSPDRLVFSTRSGGGGWVRSSAALTSARVYFEAKWSGTTGSAATVGVSTAAAALSWVGGVAGSTGFAMDGGNVWSNGSSSAYSTSPASGSTLMVALDPAAGKGWIGVAGAWLNAGDPAAGTNPTFTTNVAAGNFVALGIGGAGLSDIWTLRFAAETWERAAPTGFGAMT